MQPRPRPVLLLVGATSADPMEVVVEGYGLRMVVVNKESLRLLDSDWDTASVYLLLGRAEDPAKYTAYVGEATKQGLSASASTCARRRTGTERCS